MGCRASKLCKRMCGGTSEAKLVFKSNYFLDLEEQFLVMGMKKKDCQRLYSVFKDISVIGQPKISLQMLLSYVMLEQTKFTERVFSFFKKGPVDFKEFVCAVWNFCTLEGVALAKFTFDMYDEDGSGFLDMDEMERMLEDVYDKKREELHHIPLVRDIIVQLEKLQKKRELSAIQFVKFTRTHHALLFPTGQVQAALRGRLLDVSFWARQTANRARLCPEGYIPARSSSLSNSRAEEAALRKRERRGLELTTTGVELEDELSPGDMRGWGTGARRASPKEDKEVPMTNAKMDAYNARQRLHQTASVASRIVRQFSGRGKVSPKNSDGHGHGRGEGAKHGHADKGHGGHADKGHGEGHGHGDGSHSPKGHGSGGNSPLNSPRRTHGDESGRRPSDSGRRPSSAQPSAGSPKHKTRSHGEDSGRPSSASQHKTRYGDDSGRPSSAGSKHKSDQAATTMEALVKLHGKHEGREGGTPKHGHTKGHGVDTFNFHGNAGGHGDSGNNLKGGHGSGGNSHINSALRAESPINSARRADAGPKGHGDSGNNLKGGHGDAGAGGAGGEHQKTLWEEKHGHEQAQTNIIKIR